MLRLRVAIRHREWQPSAQHDKRQKPRNTHIPVPKTTVMQSGTNLFAKAKRFVESKHPYATDEPSEERRVPFAKPLADHYRSL